MPINDFAIDSYPINFEPPVGSFPTVVSASAPFLSRVIVSYSLAMDPLSGIANPDNYNIPGSTVISVLVDPSNLFVTLTTYLLEQDTNYTVTVNEVGTSSTDIPLVFPNFASFLTETIEVPAPIPSGILPGDFCPEDNPSYV